MSKPSDVDAAIGRGLKYLTGRQEDDGSFTSWSSERMSPFRRLRDWHTVFVPALMLCALTALDEPSAMKIRRRLADFLLKERSDDWSFNYWAKAAPEHETQAYPDDLDDTFCALAGLYLHDPRLVDEAALVKIIRLLIAVETAPGGPYRTWFVAKDSAPVWLDVDVAVNSNVAYFLSMVSNGLPSLDGLMGEAISSARYESPYYPVRSVFVYYLARSYRGELKGRLLDQAQGMLSSAKTELDGALALSACSRLGGCRGMEESVKKLIDGQRRDGSWPAAAFYADPVKDGKPYYNGGPALTTAIVLEALALSRKYVRGASSPGTGRQESGGSTKKAVLALAKRQDRGLQADLRASLSRSLVRLADSDSGNDIICLPHRFNRSLPEPLPDTRVTDHLLNRLGLANLYGWVAYTIYDGFLDGAGKADLLSAANTAMRRSQDGFISVFPKNGGWRTLVGHVFDTIDGANAWEQAHCRFQLRNDRLKIGPLPDHGNMSKLAERSLGHALPVMAVASASGTDISGPAGRHLLKAVEHYLIARQLGDDMHDWAEDLANGNMTPAVVAVLKDMKLEGGWHDIDDILPAARRAFWHRTLPKLCTLAGRHVATGRKALERYGPLTEDNIISRLLDGAGAVAAEAAAKQAQADSFLKHYERTGA